jgi:hypothetical protein
MFPDGGNGNVVTCQSSVHRNLRNGCFRLIIEQV